MSLLAGLATGLGSGMQTVGAGMREERLNREKAEAMKAHEVYMAERRHNYDMKRLKAQEEASMRAQLAGQVYAADVREEEQAFETGEAEKQRKHQVGLAKIATREKIKGEEAKREQEYRKAIDDEASALLKAFVDGSGALAPDAVAALRSAKTQEELQDRARKIVTPLVNVRFSRETVAPPDADRGVLSAAELKKRAKERAKLKKMKSLVPKDTVSAPREETTAGLNLAAGGTGSAPGLGLDTGKTVGQASFIEYLRDKEAERAAAEQLAEKSKKARMRVTPISRAALSAK